MKRTNGFTIIELMIVIVVSAVGVALAVPSFRDTIERKRLSGATEAAFQHLQRAKSQAVKRSKPIVVDFNVNGTSWAIGFTDKLTGCNAEDVSGTGLCDLDEDNDNPGTVRLVMRVLGSDFNNITMSQVTAFPVVAGTTCATAPAGQACFDYIRGLARTGEYEFASSNYKLRLQVTMLGNVNVCVPAGSKVFPGYKGC